MGVWESNTREISIQIKLIKRTRDKIPICFYNVLTTSVSNFENWAEMAWNQGRLLPEVEKKISSVCETKKILFHFCRRNRLYVSGLPRDRIKRNKENRKLNELLFVHDVWAENECIFFSEEKMILVITLFIEHILNTKNNIQFLYRLRKCINSQWLWKLTFWIVGKWILRAMAFTKSWSWKFLKWNNTLKLSTNCQCF